jgi:ABC-2 type transport system permease protein
VRINLYRYDVLSPLLFGIAGFVGYLSSMKADTKRIAIHDESGLFVEEFVAKNVKKVNTNILIYRL